MLVGSLFSGIGGLDLGLAQAGHEHFFLCEADQYRRNVLRQHFTGTPVFSDVRSLGKPAWGASTDETGASVNFWRWETGTGLLCGGFPCQDLSVAGKRKGLAGDRSGLFFEFARIAAFLKPRFVLLENVPGIFSSHGGRDFGVLLETLVQLGYGVGWRVFDSRFFGVPQRRRRVFILGTLADGDIRAAAHGSGEILAVSTGCGWHPKKGSQKRKNDTRPSLSGLGDGGPDDNDAQAGRIVAAPLSSNKESGYRYDSDTVDSLIPQQVGVRRLTPVECERLQGFPDNWTQLGDTKDARRYAALGDAITVNVAKWIGERLET